MVAADVARGDMPLSLWDPRESGLLLDVRHPQELTVVQWPEVVRSAYTGQPTLSPEATRALVHSKAGPLSFDRDLTAREKQVLALIVEGLSNEEIADRLVISQATARHHVSACISKLGVKNRTQAASLALKHELI